MNKIAHAVAKAADELGFLHSTKYRNYCIVEEFEKLRKEDVSVETAIFQLAGKHSLTFDSVSKIIYPRGNSKK